VHSYIHPITIPVSMLGAAGQARLLGEMRQQCGQVRCHGSRLASVRCRAHSTAAAAAAFDSTLHSQQQHQQLQAACWHQQQHQQHLGQRLRCSSYGRDSSAAGFCSSCCVGQPAATQGFPPLARLSSRAGHRPSRSAALRVVALDRDEDYEQPPEAGKARLQLVLRVQQAR
jgi:hypothetical protein